MYKMDVEKEILELVKWNNELTVYCNTNMDDTGFLLRWVVFLTIACIVMLITIVILAVRVLQG